MLPLLSEKIEQLKTALAGDDHFVIKSIYFDKPERSNWFVAWHQDLMISVKEKAPAEGYGPWTAKTGYYNVQSPAAMLADNLTIRIHIDDTDEHNGALRVLPGSHKNGIYPASAIKEETKEDICRVQKGGVMIMRPLLFHASGRTTDGRRRRVIHVEFSRHTLPAPMMWDELIQ